MTCRIEMDGAEKGDPTTENAILFRSMTLLLSRVS